MHEGVANCEIIAPRISEKLVLGEVKDVKYELGNMKAVEDAVFPNPVQHEIDADYTVIPIKPSEQNECQPPNLLKVDVKQNKASPIIHSDETKDSNSLVDTCSLEEDLVIAEVVEDLCDLPNADYYKVGSSEYLATIIQKESEKDEISVQLVDALTAVELETKMVEVNESKGQEEALNSASDKEELETIPAEDIVNDTPTSNSHEESEIIASRIEESLDIEPSASASVNKEVITEYTGNATTTQDTEKEEITSSNQNLEEAEAIPSATEDKEDEEERAPEGEECESPSAYDKTESVYDDTEASSSEDEENSSSCRAMKGREYFSHYQKHKKKEVFTMYPLGKVYVPRGFLLHFRASTRRQVIHMTREYIRDALLPLGAEIAFIDYQKGQLSGWVRFQETCPAINILKQMTNNTIRIKNVYMEFSKVPKHDEVKYLNQVGKAMAQLRQKKTSLDTKLKKKGLKKI